MATVTKRGTHEAAAAVLHGVSYREYARLTGLDANRHLRMAYHDGTLEIMSPRISSHELPSERIALIIRVVALNIGINYEAIGSGTVRRRGDGPLKGTGREPDKGFYFANVDRFPTDREPDLDAGDPPPDLWLEVDNRVSSQAKLPTFARLGVPEVWRYRSQTNTLRFLHLIEGKYEPITHSLALPVLTPALVLEALNAGGSMREGEWLRWLQPWAERFRPADV